MSDESSRGYTLRAERARAHALPDDGRAWPARTRPISGSTPASAGRPGGGRGLRPRCGADGDRQSRRPRGHGGGVEPGQPAREAAREELRRTRLRSTSRCSRATARRRARSGCLGLRDDAARPHPHRRRGRADRRPPGHAARAGWSPLPGRRRPRRDTTGPTDPDIQQQFERYAEFHRSWATTSGWAPASGPGACGRTRGRRAPGRLPARPRDAHGRRRAAGSPPRTR